MAKTTGMCYLGSGGWKSKIQESAGPLLSQISILGYLHRVFPLDVSVSNSLPGGSVLKNLSANAGDAGLIPRSGRYSRVGNGSPLQYSCLDNLMGSKRVGSN